MSYLKLILTLTICLSSTLLSLELPKFPTVPFELTAPVSPPQHFGEKKIDLKTIKAYELSSVAENRAQQGHMADAIQLQYWACQNKPTEGLYNLARYYSITQKLKEATFTIQQAASAEGVNYQWATQDPALEKLRASEYWQKLNTFLKECDSLWQKSNYGRATITKAKTSSDTLIIGLHGYGSKPEDFSEGEGYQKVADSLKATFVSISATIPIGRHSFRWSEDLDKDYTRIKTLLKTQGIDLETIKQKTILIGFSQGAQLSAELAARYPEKFAGAIIMCPGMKSNSRLQTISNPKKQTGKNYIIINGSKEKEKNLSMGKTDKDWFEKQGAKVIYHIYPEMGHSFPQLYFDQLSQWIQFISK